MIEPLNMVPSKNIESSSSSHPQIIPPLNMVVPDEVNAEPSSSQPPFPEPTEDTSVRDNLVSHSSGELQ